MEEETTDNGFGLFIGCFTALFIEAVICLIVFTIIFIVKLVTAS